MINSDKLSVANNKSHRLLAVDLLRGATVAGMIMANNGGGNPFESLRHATWNGLSLSDLVFPFFLFIMGVSIFLSYSRRGFTLTKANFFKILKRTVVLFLIGLFINWLEKWIHTDWSTSIAELRFWAVLQRIAVCYFVVSIFVLTAKHKWVLPLAIALLALYAGLLIGFDGYVNDQDKNFMFQIDKALFGYDHIYHWQGVDPEGLVSTMSSIANVLFGFYCAMKIHAARNDAERSTAALTVGAMLLLIGFAIQFGLPLNKRIWSPSFSLVTSGLCSLLLGLTLKWSGHTPTPGPIGRFFRVFGTNALILYVTSELMAIILGHFGINDLLWEGLLTIIPAEHFASLAYSIVYILVNWIIGYILWKNKIFIKL